MQTGVTIGLLTLIFSRTGFAKDAARVLTESRVGWVSIALVCALIVQLFQLWRWRICMLIQGIELPLLHVLRLYGLSLFSSLLFLGPLGGDAVRILLLIREGANRQRAAVSVLMDRISGLGALILVAGGFTVARIEWFAADPLAAGLVWIFGTYLACSAALLALSFVVGRKGWLEHLAQRVPARTALIEMVRAWDAFSRQWGRAAFAILISLGALMVYLTMFLACAEAFGLRTGWRDIFAVVPVADAFAALPVSVAGLGVREKLFETMLHRLSGVEMNAAVIVSLAGFTCMSLWSALGIVCLPGYCRARGERLTVRELQEEAVGSK